MSISNDHSIKAKSRTFADLHTRDEIKITPPQNSFISPENDQPRRARSLSDRMYSLYMSSFDHQRRLVKINHSNHEQISGLEQQIAAIQGLIVNFQQGGPQNDLLICNFNLQIGGLQKQIIALTKVAVDQDGTPLRGGAQQEASSSSTRDPGVAQASFSNVAQAQASEALVAKEVEESSLEETWTTDVFEQEIRLPSIEEGIKAMMVRRKKDNDAPWIPVGYYDGTSWPKRRWAYAPQESGRVPVRDGDALGCWYNKNWLKDHQYGGKGFITGTPYLFWGAKKSGENNCYTHANDENGRDYITIPVSSQSEFTGYVPARQVDISLKNGYLTSPHNFKLIADKVERLFIACSRIPYEMHGFSLCSLQLGPRNVEIWWPVRNGIFNDSAEMKEKIRTIVNAVLERFGHPKI